MTMLLCLLHFLFLVMYPTPCLRRTRLLIILHMYLFVLVCLTKVTLGHGYFKVEGYYDERLVISLLVPD